MVPEWLADIPPMCNPPWLATSSNSYFIPMGTRWDGMDVGMRQSSQETKRLSALGTGRRRHTLEGLRDPSSYPFERSWMRTLIGGRTQTRTYTRSNNRQPTYPVVEGVLTLLRDCLVPAGLRAISECYQPEAGCWSWQAAWCWRKGSWRVDATRIHP